VLPPVVVGYGLLLLFSPVKSPLGRWLMASGFEVVYTWRAVALACAVVSLPLLLRSVKTAVEAVDTRLERAARLLGAGPWRVFFSITLPLSLRGIIAGAILAFTRSVGEFGATVMFAGMIPNRTVTLSSAVFQKIMLLDDDRGALRLVIVSVLLSVAALMIAEWLNRRAVRGMPE
jgi:molybdate transport system permease protein